MYKVRSLSQVSTRNFFLSKRCLHERGSSLLFKNLKSAQKCQVRGNAKQSSSSSSSAYAAGTMAVVGLVCGGVTIYANYDDKFRRNLEDTLPFIKPAFDSLYGELSHTKNALPIEKDLSIPFEIKDEFNEPANEKASYKSNDGFVNSSDVVVINTLDSPGVSSLDLDIVKIGSKMKKNEKDEKSETSFEEEQQKSLENSEKEKQNIPENKIEPAPEINKESSTEEAIESTNLPIEENVVQSIPDDSAPLTPEEIANLSEIVDQTSLEVLLEATVEDISERVNSYLEIKKKATESLSNYIQTYVNAIALENDEAWKEANKVEQSSQVLIDETIQKGSNVTQDMDSLNELINTIKASGVSDIADKATEILEKYKNKLQSVADDFDNATNNLEFITKVHSEINSAPINVQNSLRSSLPGLIAIIDKYKTEIDVTTLSPKDALVGFILKKNELLESQTENLDNVSEARLNEMLEEQKQVLQQEVEKKLKNEIDKVYLEQENKYHKQVMQLEEEYEKEILAQLKRQAMAHSEHLKEQLETLSSNLNSQHQQEMDSKIKELRESNQFELEKQLAFINGIQSKISEVVDMDTKQRRIQELFIAAQALNASLKESLLHGRTRTLMREMLSVLNLAGNNLVIEEIISCLPEEAATLGVVPEKDLIARFDNVKRACKKVALIGEEGGAVPLYFLSYLKSLFMFSAWYKNDLENDVNLDELGPYEILAKADYFIQRGDLEQATKFMSQLKGVSRKLCSDWLREARLFLETRQTARLLLAYASSLSVSAE